MIDNNEISIKELYERLIAIEVRMDEMKLRQNRNTQRFTWYVAILIVLNIFNIFIHLLLMQL